MTTGKKRKGERFDKNSFLTGEERRHREECPTETRGDIRKKKELESYPEKNGGGGRVDASEAASDFSGGQDGD